MANRTETKSYRVNVETGDALSRLKELTDAVANAQDRLTKAQQSNDAAGVAKAKREIKAATKELQQYQQSLNATKAATENLDSLTFSQLKSAYRGLKREVESLDRSSQEYRDGMQRLQEVDKRIKEHTNALKGAGVESENFAGKVAGFFKGVASGAVSLLKDAGAAALNVLRQSAREYQEFNERVQNLSSLSDLKGEELKYMSDAAKELSTSVAEGGVRITQSAGSILDAFSAMGGAKAELLEDKEALVKVTEAALVMGQAAGMEAKEAVDSLALTMNQFGAGAEEVTRYINVLAAGSGVGAAEIDEVAASIKNFGASANGANISIEESVGLIETLAAKGVKGEVAGTALNSILTRLQTGADEFNPKIVGMQQALENLANANLSTAEMVKIFGQGQISAGQILMANRAEFAKLTREVTNTNTAYEMAATNTDTLAARQAQNANAWKNLRLEIGEKLQPVIASFQERMLEVALKLKGLGDVLSPIIRLGKKAVDFIFSLTGRIMGLIGPIRNLGERFQWLNVLLNPLKIGVEILGDSFNKLNGILKYSKSNLERETEMMADLNQEMAKGTSEMEVLFTSLSNVNQSAAERAKTIQKINELYGDYLPKLLTEQSSQEEIAAAQELANQALMRNILLKQQSARLEKLQQEEIQRTADMMGEIQEVLAKRLGSTAAAAGKELSVMIGKGQTSQQQIQEWARRWKLEEGNLFKKGSGWILDQVQQLQKLRGEYKDLGNNARDFYTNIAAAKGVTLEAPKTYQHEGNAPTQAPDTPAMPIQTADPAVKAIEQGMEARKNATAKGLKEIENVEDIWLQKSVNALKRNLLEKRITQEEYEDEMLSLELTYLLKQRGNLEKQGKSTAKVEERIYDQQLKLQKRAEQKAEKAREKAQKKREKERQQDHDRLAVFLQRETEEVQDNVDREAELFTQQQERQIQEQAARAKGLQEFLQGTQAAGQEFAEGAIGLIGEMIAGSEDAQENFGKRMAQMAFNMLHKIVRMAIGQIWAQAMASPESVASYGVAGAAKATALTAIVEAAFAVAKKIFNAGQAAQNFRGRLHVTGQEDGLHYQVPYLGEIGGVAYIDRPALISERGGEIIIDHERSRRIMLNYPHLLEQIRAVPQHSTGRLPQPPHANGTNNTPQPNGTTPTMMLKTAPIDPATLQTLQQLQSTLKSLENTLKQGIEATISYHQLKHTLTRGEEAERVGKNR